MNNQNLYIKKTQLQDGFSLLELLVVMSILVVLAAVTAPSYERYLKRAKSTELILGLGPYKVAMMEWLVDNGAANGWPANANAMNWPVTHSGEYITDISYQRTSSRNRAAIVVTGDIDGEVIQFYSEGLLVDGGITWRCTSRSPSREFLPSSCAMDPASGL